MGDNLRQVNNVLVTGATSGIGLEMAEQLIAQGKNVYLVGRNQTKLDNLVNELNRRKGDTQTVESFCFDIGQLSEVQSIMPRICQVPLDTVIFNAAVIFPERRPQHINNLPYLEETLKVNILGHFVMARHLLKTDQPIRFVCVSSIMAKTSLHWNRWPSDCASFYRFFRSTDWFSDGWWSYFDSKLAAIIMAQWLEKQNNVSGVAIHPGVASTQIIERIPKSHIFCLQPLRYVAPRMEPVAICAARVIENAVLSNDNFTNHWFCEKRIPIPTVNLSETQKDEFIKFLFEVTERFA